MGRTLTALIILNVGAWWRFLYPSEIPPYPLNRSLAGPQSRSGRVGENSLTRDAIRIPDHPARSLVTCTCPWCYGSSLTRFKLQHLPLESSKCASVSLSQRCSWGLPSSEMWRPVSGQMVLDVSTQRGVFSSSVSLWNPPRLSHFSYMPSSI